RFPELLAEQPEQVAAGTGPLALPSPNPDEESVQAPCDRYVITDPAPKREPSRVRVRRSRGPANATNEVRRRITRKGSCPGSELNQRHADFQAPVDGLITVCCIICEQRVRTPAASPP